MQLIFGIIWSILKSLILDQVQRLVTSYPVPNTGLFGAKNILFFNKGYRNFHAQILEEPTYDICVSNMGKCPSYRNFLRFVPYLGGEFLCWMLLGVA